jgi:hypothetical protein
MKAAYTAAAQTMLASLTPGSESTWMLQFALAGRAAHENDAAAAMAQYDQANAAKLATMHYQADTVDQFFDALIRCFDVGMNGRLSRTGDQDAKPVFIAGMTRSGTTLAEQIIASISGVHGAGELSAVENLARDVYRHEGAWPGGAKALTSERAAALSTQHSALSTQHSVYVDSRKARARCDPHRRQDADEFPEPWSDPGCISKRQNPAHCTRCHR